MQVEFQISDSGRCHTVEGQEARALIALVGAGPVGITALGVSNWALRLAHYVFKLRRLGLTIDMVRERHGGPAPGKHGRYFLRTPVLILSSSEQLTETAA